MAQDARAKNPGRCFPRWRRGGRPIPAGRSDRGADARRDRDPRADGDRAARRLRAADRLLRLHRGLDRLCDARRQPLPVLRRQFHHHADLRRRAGGAGRVRLARLSGARGGAGADGRRDAGRRRHVPSRLDRQSAVDAGDGRLPRRHLRAHPGLAIARRARPARAERADARPHRRSWRGISARPISITLCIGFGVLAVVAGSEADQRQNSRRADRPRRGDAGGDLRPGSRAKGVQRGRHGAGDAADAGAARSSRPSNGRGWCR